VKDLMVNLLSYFDQFRPLFSQFKLNETSQKPVSICRNPTPLKIATHDKIILPSCGIPKAAVSKAPTQSNSSVLTV
jgi:hypothetical protein